MNEEKKWYQSTTLQGTIISFLSLIINWIKFPISVEELTNGVSAVFVLIGFIVIIIGRIKTKGEQIRL